MGLESKIPTIDLYLKQGEDIVNETITIVEDGEPLSYAGATARWPLIVEGQGDVIGLSTTVSAYGGLSFGVDDEGNSCILYTITNAATQALFQAMCGRLRGVHSLYVDWPDGTSRCYFDGPFYLKPGSPF